MQVSKRKGIKLPLGYQFILSFDSKGLQETKSILTDFMCAQKSSEKDFGVVLSHFNVGILNSVWNIWSVKIASNEATFIFRDARFQNTFVFIVPVLIFLSHLFVFPDFELGKALVSSIVPFLAFFLFFYIGRNVVLWRIYKRLKAL